MSLRRISTTAVILSVLGFGTFVVGAFVVIVTIPATTGMVSGGILALVGLSVLLISMRVL